ncbi:KGGVGR-motif variant AAA ATPase [Pseudokineococcus marinus]
MALYSFKGGVGRSTAGAWLARVESGRGKCVLVVDLDLESPGVSNLLSHVGDLPSHGVVDQMVETAVGNVEELDTVALAHIDDLTAGEVWIAPAQGRPREGYTFLPKLNRVYSPITIDGRPLTFADRVESAVSASVEAVRRRSREPDLVLLDSRAGLHDIAAAVVTRLAGTTLVFSGDSEATWIGYGNLASEWGSNAALATRMRSNIKMVASLAPDVGEEAYLARFAERSYACWSSIYDDLQAGDAYDEDAYNPPPNDTSAPHYPLPITFDPTLRHLERASFLAAFESRVAQAAFQRFTQGVQDIIDSGELDGTR